MVKRFNLLLHFFYHFALSNPLADNLNLTFPKLGKYANLISVGKLSSQSSILSANALSPKP